MHHCPNFYPHVVDSILSLGDDFYVRQCRTLALDRRSHGPKRGKNMKDIDLIGCVLRIWFVGFPQATISSALIFFFRFPKKNLAGIIFIFLNAWKRGKWGEFGFGVLPSIFSVCPAFVEICGEGGLLLGLCKSTLTLLFPLNSSRFQKTRPIKSIRPPDQINWSSGRRKPEQNSRTGGRGGCFMFRKFRGLEVGIRRRL